MVQAMAWPCARATLWCMRCCCSSSSSSSSSSASCRGASLNSQFQLAAPPLHLRWCVRGRAVSTLLSSSSSPPSALDSKAEVLWAWLAEKGAVSAEATAVRPAHVSQGLGLLAQRDVSQGDGLLSIPRNLWINLETVRASEIGHLCDGLKPWLAIALFIIREKARLDSSWRSYLDILPKNLDSPLYWSNEELAELQGTQLLGSTLSYRDYVDIEVNELLEKVIKPNPELFDQSLFTYDAFLWAFGILKSRTFAPLIGNELALVPLADLVNHLANVQDDKPCWERTTAGFFARQEVLFVRAAKKCHIGQEVVMQYGKSKSNAQLALDYGFVEYDASSVALRSNDRDSFKLSLEISESDNFFDDKLDVAQLAGLDSSVHFILTRGQDPPEKMITFLRLTALGGSDAFLLEALFRDTVWDHLSLPISRDNEEAICEAMIEGCKTALCGYPSSVQEDISLLKDDNLDPRKRIAAVVRQGEKSVLQEVQTWFEVHMNELDQLEYYAERRLRDLGLLDEKGSMTPWARVWN